MLKICDFLFAYFFLSIISYFYIVHIKTILISYFLIFCYTLGFAHSFIPHSDESIEGQHIHDIVHSHNHHHTVTENKTSNNSITHQDHFDENVYDYLLCLFSDLEHGESECSMDHEAPNKTISGDITFENQVFILSSFFNLETIFNENNKQTPSYFSGIVTYKSPTRSQNSLRGPPFFPLT